MKVLQIIILFSTVLGYSIPAICQNRLEDRVLIRGRVEFEATFYSSGKLASPRSPGKGAIIDAIDKNGNRFSTTTDEKGNYEIKLPIGEYQIQAYIPTGFSVEITSAVNNLVVIKAKKIRLNFTLSSSGCG